MSIKKKINPEPQGPLEQAVQFVVHTLIGIILFLTLAAAAVLLSKIVHYLESIHTDPMIIFGLSVAEKLIFGADLLGFIMWLTAHVVNICKKFWSEIKWW